MLEEKVSYSEGQVKIIEEKFRKRDNERCKQFFYSNKIFDDKSNDQVGARIKESAMMARD
jgi:hypothetical protein